MAAEAVTSVEDEAAIYSLLRHAAVTGVAGVVSGVLVGGVGGRLVMRVAAIAAPDRVTGIATENGNRIGDITIGGTVAIIIFVGIFSGIFGAIFYVITEEWLKWSGRWHAPIFAVLLLLTGGHTVLVPGNFDFAILRNQELNVSMFVVMFLVFGLLLVWLRGVLDARLPKAGGAGPPIEGYAVLCAIGALVVPVMVIQFFSEGSCGCEPAPVLGASVIAMGLVTLALWLLSLTDRIEVSWLPFALRLGGYAAVAVAAVAGTLRLVSDVREIV